MPLPTPVRVPQCCESWAHRPSALPEANLAQARAANVAQLLIAAGVPAERIAVAGKGAADPVADSATAQGSGRNRRVDSTVSD